MGDRASIPTIPGSLTGFVDVGIQVAYFATANQLERFSAVVTDPPSSGSVTVELNTASDGSGDSISVTIADGTRFATGTGAVAIPAGGALYLIVTAESGSALNLSGSYEVTATSGVTTFLTTLANVKRDMSITTVDATRDAEINAVIAGVSQRMQSWMDRKIVQTTATSEKIDSDGDHALQTRHYPIISVTSCALADGTSLVENTDFEVTAEDKLRGWLIRISGGYLSKWEKGRRAVTVTYEHGYAAVPDDLVRAATSQVVVDFSDTKQSGGGWRGLLSKGVDPAASVAYDKEFWQRNTVPVMQPYRRMVA